ncbi:hypothetical protein E2C01_032755 [Portunus trituberculatus]|uniref:Uncharacterized protein n=1 Tax=Portunus trituberculatus TaxID=210409 RepID=A0A5B7F181_PORTR|nr:hypothetical protein [Portunus trituberculatus]
MEPKIIADATRSSLPCPAPPRSAPPRLSLSVAVRKAAIQVRRFRCFDLLLDSVKLRTCLSAVNLEPERSQEENCSCHEVKYPGLQLRRWIDTKETPQQRSACEIRWAVSLSSSTPRRNKHQGHSAMVTALPRPGRAIKRSQNAGRGNTKINKTALVRPCQQEKMKFLMKRKAWTPLTPGAALLGLVGVCCQPAEGKDIGEYSFPFYLFYHLLHPFFLFSIIIVSSFIPLLPIYTDT